MRCKATNIQRERPTIVLKKAVRRELMRKTNSEFVDDLMNYSPHGALAQVFIMEAIRKYSEQVAEADPKIFEGGFIDGPAWQGVAKDILQRMKERGEN